MLRFAILAVTFALAGIVAGGSVAAAPGPMADAGLDQTVTVETTVQLDGTGSGHPDGPLSGYEWTIRTPDDRKIEPDCPDCERTQFTPSMVGRYEVTLTVTGPDGARSTDTLYVYVEDAGPDVSLSGERSPDPNEPVTYTATAESSDAELEEVAWAVEDQIVAVRPLEGSSDESQLSLTFTETETHRVQVVVRDSNGRTAYDQLYVRPRSESFEPTNWSDVEPPDCSDSGYAARNSEECWDIETPERTPDPDSDDSEDESVPESFEIRYVTEGYDSDMFLGMQVTDSSYLGRTNGGTGIDGGEHAPWNGGVLEETYDNTVGDGLRTLFGQEQRTVTCNIEGGNLVGRGCAESVSQLERNGGTTNAYSPAAAGSYSEYGLKGGERISGTDPTKLQDGQSAEVTIVVQQQKDGLVDKVVEEVDSSTDRVRNSVNGILGDDERMETESDSRESSSDTVRSDSDWNSGALTGGNIDVGYGNDATTPTSTSEDNTDDIGSRNGEDSQSSNDSERPTRRRGVI
jgi:hypothetical protein